MAERDEFDVFLQQQKRARIKRIGLLAVFALGAYILYLYAPSELKALMSSSSGLPPDDPRVLFKPASSLSGDDDGDLDSDLERSRILFGILLPEHWNLLQMLQRDADAPHALVQRLNTSRTRLRRMLRSDPSLDTVVSSILRLASHHPFDHYDKLMELTATLNTLLLRKNIPITVEFESSDSSTGERKRRLPLLRVYEKLQPFTLRWYDETINIPVVYRIDAGDLIHDPDRPAARPRSPTVHVRWVLSRFYAELFSALDEDGMWPLARVTPPSLELIGLERTLGQALRERIRLPPLSENAEKAWTKVVAHVAARNALFREINDRDPDRLTPFVANSVALGEEGHRWIEQIKPYVIRGTLRLTLSDLALIEHADAAILPHVEPIVPRLRALMERALRWEAMGQAARARLPAEDFNEPADAAKISVDGMESIVSRLRFEVSDRLARLAMSADACILQLSETAADAVDAPQDKREAARYVLSLLSQTAPLMPSDSDAEITRSIEPTTLGSLNDHMNTLLEEECRVIQTRAIGWYEIFFGPWSPPEFLEGPGRIHDQ